MCSGGGSPKMPKPIPPPIFAEYAQQKKRRKRPVPGTTNPNVLTSALGLSGDAQGSQPTLLGR